METTEDKNKNINTSLIVAQPSIAEFKEIIKDIAKNPNVLALKERAQHKNASRYYHCISVSYYTYYLCKKLKLDYVSAARGAMLHDFYYYDWRDKKVEGQKRFHAFRHPRIALNNAEDIFDLNDLEKDIILKHMWPLTIIPPAYKESYIVTLVDKYCATNEMFKKRMKRNKHNDKNKLLESINKNSEIETTNKLETKETESEITNEVKKNSTFESTEIKPKIEISFESKENNFETQNGFETIKNKSEMQNGFETTENKSKTQNGFETTENKSKTQNNFKTIKNKSEMQNGFDKEKDER